MDPLALHLNGPGSLMEALGAIPDPRSKQGQSQKNFAGLLTLIAMSHLAGMQSFLAMSDYIQALPQKILAACGLPCGWAWPPPSTQRSDHPTCRHPRRWRRIGSGDRPLDARAGALAR